MRKVLGGARNWRRASPVAKEATEKKNESIHAKTYVLTVTLEMERSERST